METSSRLLLTFLLNACWQIALIAAVASCCNWLLRETAARYRNWLWVAALILSIGLPVLTSSRNLEGALSGVELIQPQTNAQQTNAVLTSFSQDNILGEKAALPVPSSIPQKGALISFNRSLAMALVLLYLLFLCYRSLKLLNVWRKTSAMSRLAYSVDFSEHVQTIIRHCQNTIGVTRVRILCSVSIPVPVTVGTINPLIILPAHLTQETDNNILATAIGHELVHIRRHDYLLNLIYEFIYLPLSFHPAAWLMRRRINQTRELGCDELVTEKLIDPATYARSLVQLASAAIPLRRSATTITVGIADADILEERIMTILKRSKANVSKKRWLLIAATLGLAIPCLAATPFALRININSPASAAPMPEAVATAAEKLFPQQQNAQQEEAKVVKQKAELEAKLKAEHAALLEGKAEFQGQVFDVVLDRGFAFKTQQDAQQVKEMKEVMRERMEQMVKEAREKDPSADPQEIKQKVEMMVLDRVKEERFHVEQDAQNPEFIAHRQAEREAMAKRRTDLVKEARITMQQALQIATNQYPGTVMESRLVRERNQACYFFTILSENGAETTTSVVLISAVDGSILDLMKERR